METMKPIRFDELSPLQQSLFDPAAAARANAYEPYSHYAVGAALVDDQGQIWKGCNVENAAYKGGCSEFNAINTMIANGGQDRKFTALYCITRDAKPPCGACLQHMLEFCAGPDAAVIISSPDKTQVKIATVATLLPYGFTLDSESSEPEYDLEALKSELPEAAQLEDLIRPKDEFELTVRAYNGLANTELVYVFEVAMKPARELLRRRNFGRMSLNDIRESMLAPFGLDFGMKFSPELVRWCKQQVGRS
jgi:cytidine deaminase